MYILWSLKIILKIAEKLKQAVNWQWDRTRFGMRNRLLSSGRYFWFFSPISSRPLKVFCIAEGRVFQGAVVGICCQGRWCVIFSPLCLFPVGHGLLELGVADFGEQEEEGESQWSRQESGQSNWTTVTGQQLGFFTCFSALLLAEPRLDSSEPGKRIPSNCSHVSWLLV